MTELTKLRSKLRSLEIDAFLVLTCDAHNSEYVSDADLRRSFITKFTGSAGTALILQDAAYLWTDGRYFLQAELELSNEWTLMKIGQPNVPDLSDWIITNMKAGSKVGVDPFLIPATIAKTFSKKFHENEIQLIPVEKNPIDEIWDEIGRPTSTIHPLIIMNDELTGESSQQKIQMVREFLIKNSSFAMIVTMLDEIAWLLNIRGNDIHCNPVAIAYVIVTLNDTYLFIQPEKVTDKVKQHLQHIKIFSYNEITNIIESQFLINNITNDLKIIVDGEQINWFLYQLLKNKVLEKTSPITLRKSKKNINELNGFREAHIRDGAALTAFFHWLETTTKNDPNTITEYEVTLKIEEFRCKMKMHMGPSFDTIAAYGSNGAMMHYKPSMNDSFKIGIESTYLQDSGAQYLDGTTDVTRTHHFGIPTMKIKEAYTAVLKGHIKLASLIFPEGTLGSRMDVLARMALWEQGLDYNHGTGHGVGSFLNVHEGPQGISPRSRPTEVGYFAGMTTSNEPGYYEDGEFGIRIENLCITVPKDTSHNFGGKKYLGFETVTMCPIATNMILVERLTAQEISWLNDYHHQVFIKLSPLISEHFPSAWDYLVEKTKPIAY